MTTLLSTPITESLIRGAIEIEPTANGHVIHRLPLWARRQNRDPQLAMAEAQPSGVHLALVTTARLIELDTIPTRRDYVGLPGRPHGIYDLVVDGQLVAQRSAPDAHILRIDMRTGSSSLEEGPVQTLRFDDLPAGEKQVEIWLPHGETTELVGLRSDAPLLPATRTLAATWLHHGSSISQGSNAASPTGIWPAVAARLAGMDLVNLGFGGSALLDPFVARTMRDLPAERISIEMGINLVNLDLMRLRAFVPALHGFLDTIREGQPKTPILLLSPLFCPIHEDTPGPGQFDLEALGEGKLLFRATGNPEEVAAGKLTLRVIREAMLSVVAERAANDPNLFYLDGLTLYGEADHARLPLPDRLHPDAETHLLIGERFASGSFLFSGPVRNR